MTEVIKDTSGIGDVACASLLAALVRNGYRVLLPFSAALRYDLAIEQDGNLFRIQVKAGHRENGALVFNTTSRPRTGRQRPYLGEIEFFGVWDKEDSACYLVPIEEVGLSKGYMRLEPVKNGQSKLIRWARDFALL